MTSATLILIAIMSIADEADTMDYTWVNYSFLKD